MSESLREGISSTLFFTTKLLENKSRYMPNDVLCLYCEYVYTGGDILYENGGDGVISTDVNYVESQNLQAADEEETLNQSALVRDLKFIYNDAILCDMEVRTLTQTFPAHKAVLSARSPVFRSMFSYDMKEQNSGQVQITDFEDDIVSKMLVYMYTDSLEDLQFESAAELYVAADKYQIPSLKSRCSSVLKDNLTPIRSSEALILSDRHQDIDLKDYVTDYILENFKEVFGSEGWKDFMVSHLNLAASVMYLFAQSKIYDPETQ